MTNQGASSVWEAIATRKSVRSFSETPVEREKLDKVIEAARLAPSWANKQCWHFVVVEGGVAVDDLGLVPSYIKNAPVLIVACGDPDKSGNREGKPYYMVDVAIAVEHMVLQAWELGLGTVWVGALKEEKVRKALGIPEKFRIVALLPMGYPADAESFTSRLVRKVVGSANRREAKEIVHWGKW